MAPPSREYIYGLNPAFEVLRAGRRTVYQASLNHAAREQPRMRKLLGALDRAEVPVEWVDKGRVFQLAQSKDHQGVVLKTSPYPYVPFEEALDKHRVLLLDNVEDPHNVGAILRSAEIFGFEHVLMSHKGTPLVYPSVVKVSAGACEFLRVTRDRSGTRFVQALKEAGFQVAALDGKGTTTVNDEAVLQAARLTLVVGGEDRAIGQFILKHADWTVAIPQRGRINSLNASVAAAIAMYALRD
jgi:23S rRNA (guanosine2251-2'-O)-methyltransferase